jgi:hypothetical protein
VQKICICRVPEKTLGKLASSFPGVGENHSSKSCLPCVKKKHSVNPHFDECFFFTGCFHHDTKQKGYLPSARWMGLGKPKKHLAIMGVSHNVVGGFTSAGIDIFRHTCLRVVNKNKNETTTSMDGK